MGLAYSISLSTKVRLARCAHNIVIVIGDIEEGNVVVIHVPCKHNGRVITNWVLHMCLPENAFQGVEVLELIQQEPALASE